MSKKKTTRKEPKVHEDLKGFDVKVDAFGEIRASYSIDELNAFLNKNVEDKKLKEKTAEVEEG